MDSVCKSTRIPKSTSSCHEVFANVAFEKSVHRSSPVPCANGQSCTSRWQLLFIHSVHIDVCQVWTNLELIFFVFTQGTVSQQIVGNAQSMHERLPLCRLVCPVRKSASFGIPARVPHMVTVDLRFEELLLKASALLCPIAFLFRFLLTSRLKVLSIRKQRILERIPGLHFWVTRKNFT